ncbi:MAG: hypothetical protein IJC18_05580, partial [Clostridia bacterium]|nr:hypothetical protein [Clostridia bacterium]
DDYTRELAAGGARDFTDYSRQLWDACDQESLNEELIDDAATLGTGILHYYFDPSVTGGTDAPFVGEIRGETVDPLNIVFANPQMRDVQRQKYIIIGQRCDVEQVRQMAKNEGLPPEKLELIRGDNDTSHEGYCAATHEMQGEEKITLLTKYYRKDGIVYFDKSTSTVDIIKERCLSPCVGDAPYKIKLYPVALLCWYRRKKCIFGIGECQTLIPAQKAVNFLKAMELLSVQQTAWPKLIVKPGALSQPVTNEPGEVLTDYCQTGPGLYYLNPPAMTAQASNLAHTIFDLMRTTSGVSEVSTGEPIGSNIAASTVIALQSQARTPIEEIQRRFWKCIRKVGEIWVELIKAYYNFERNLTVEDAAGESGDGVGNTRLFTGAAYANIDFRLKIDVGAASEYGEVLAQSTLDMMLQRGDITIDEYVELAPHNVVPFAEQFKRIREQSGKAQEALMQRAMAEMHSAAPLAPGTNDGAISHPAGAGGANLPAIPSAPTM